MKILYKYPTRERPYLFSKTLISWYKNMTHGNFEFLISCDNDDETMKSENFYEFIKNFPNVSVRYDNNKNKIEACNIGVSEKNFDIVVLVSDDMIPEIKGYDQLIIKKMNEHFPDTDGALWFFDGYRHDINTLSILGKKYYDRFGYIYHPSYTTQWCDQEHTDVATSLGKIKKFDDLVIRHIHPEIIMNQKDAAFAYKNHIPEYASQGFLGHDQLWLRNSNGDADMQNYYKRKYNGFPL
jgi:hypothetical protein